ncbi:MAG: glycosyltransferase [Persicimonas sp.]
MDNETPIRVLHVLPWIEGGGVEHRRVYLARHLDASRFEQRLICLSSKPWFVDKFAELGVEVTEVATPRRWSVTDYAAISKIRREIVRWQPDIVHGAVYEGVSMATLAGRLAGVPIIIGEETGDPSIRSWRGNLLLAGLMRLASASVGVSRPIGEYLEDKLRLPSNRVYQIDNGVEPLEPISTSEKLRLRREWGIPPEAFVVGSVGRMYNTQKRYTDLIEAVRLLKATIPEVRLLMVGSGGEASMKLLKDHVSRCGLEGEVIFTGYRNDLESMYGMMDVFSLLSADESFGLVVADAMFCGLPVVVTRVGGMKFIVVEDETGILVEPFDPKQAADALKRLYKYPELRQRMGEAGRTRARAKYSAQRYAKDVETMYDELVTKHLHRD